MNLGSVSLPPARPSSAVWIHTEYVRFLFHMTTLQIFGGSHHVIFKATLHKAKEPSFFTWLGFRILPWSRSPYSGGVSSKVAVSLNSRGRALGLNRTSVTCLHCELRQVTRSHFPHLWNGDEQFYLLSGVLGRIKEGNMWKVSDV